MFKEAVKPEVKKPTVRAPIVYTSQKKSGATLKHSLTGKGDTKFELSGFDEADIESVVEHLKKTFKLKI